MKLDYKPVVEDSESELDQGISDPFAVDLFTDRGAGPGTASATAAPAEATDSDTGVRWDSRLQRVTESELQASAALAVLSPDFFTTLRDVVTTLLSRFTTIPFDQIQTRLVDTQETNIGADPARTGTVYATFVCGLNDATVTLELDNCFAVMIVDAMMGGNGTPPHTRRSPTTAERAVLEFLGLNLANEVNQQVDEPLLRLLSISEHPPWFQQEDFKRGLVFTTRLDVGEITDTTKVHLSDRALQELDDAHRRLRSVSEAEVLTYQRVAPDVPLSILVGRTDLSYEDFSQLERGDVMVLEWQSIRWARGRFTGPVTLRVGAADETLVTGELLIEKSARTLARRPVTTTDSETQEATSLKLRITSLKLETPGTFAGRSKMQEEVENTEELVEANQVDGVMLTVRVELAARRLRMDELIRLRVNQILDLGCEATDPVDLIVDDRRVARGELVDIEGRLGVRITKMLG